MKHLLPAAITLALSCQALAQDPSAENPPEGTPHAFDAGWQGEKTCEVLEENEHYRVARCVFPPGIGHEKHYHPRHVGYVIEGGRMQITDATGTRVQDVPTGISFSNPDWALQHLLRHGGSAYLPQPLVQPYLTDQRLHPVTGATRFQRHAFLSWRKASAQVFPWLAQASA